MQGILRSSRAGVQSVSDKGSYEEYTAKAKEAEAMADQLEDEFLKSSWLNIARGYRELAEAERASGPSSAQPSP